MIFCEWLCGPAGGLGLNNGFHSAYLWVGVRLGACRSVRVWASTPHVDLFLREFAWVTASASPPCVGTHSPAHVCLCVTGGALPLQVSHRLHQTPTNQPPPHPSVTRPVGSMLLYTKHPRRVSGEGGAQRVRFGVPTKRKSRIRL
jgi:hypothetical protein